MYSDAIQTLSEQAVVKLDGQRLSLPAHFVRSMLAGMYVGAAIVLIFIVGAFINTTAPGAVKLTMGVCFVGALTIVIFAGSELFTGSNLVLTLGVFKRKARLTDLANNWIWTWIGNLAGSMLLAFMVIQSGVMSADPVKSFVLKLVETKMNRPVVLAGGAGELARLFGRLDGSPNEGRHRENSPDLVVHVHVHQLRLRAQHREHVRLIAGNYATAWRNDFLERLLVQSEPGDAWQYHRRRRICRHDVLDRQSESARSPIAGQTRAGTRHREWDDAHAGSRTDVCWLEIIPTVRLTAILVQPAANRSA
jgi:hypothetical protein